MVEQLVNMVTGLLAGPLGYFYVWLLMTCESMILPLPSEAVMPPAGIAIARGQMSWALVLLFSTLGSLTGSLVSYAIGRAGGIPLVRRFGKYLFLDEGHLQWVHDFFAKRGQWTIFVARFIPVVRHLSSIPAGLGKMPIAKFVAYTAAGAAMWNMTLAFAGFKLGQNWEKILVYRKPIDVAMVVLLAGLFVYVLQKLRRHAMQKRASETPQT